MNDLEKKSIECLKNMSIEETTYQVARNVVLDYITNLQQENEKLKNIISSVKEDFLNANNELTNLQQELEEYKDTETYSKRFLYKANKDRLNANLDLVEENERLKDLCDKYEEEHSNEFQCWKRDRKELLDKRARIEKAVEILKNWHQEYNGLMKTNNIYIPEDKPSLFDLRDILNGRSDE